MINIPYFLIKISPSYLKRFIYNSMQKNAFKEGRSQVCVLLGSVITARYLLPRDSTCALSYRRSKLKFCVSGDVINSFSERAKNDKSKAFPSREIQRQLGTQTFSKQVEAPLRSAGFSRHSATPTASRFALRAELRLLNAGWRVARSFNKTVHFGSFEGLLEMWTFFCAQSRRYTRVFFLQNVVFRDIWV